MKRNVPVVVELLESSYRIPLKDGMNKVTLEKLEN